MGARLTVAVALLVVLVCSSACDEPLPSLTVVIEPTAADTDTRVSSIVTIEDGADDEGLSLSYQWFRNDAPIRGATQPSLDLALPDHGDRGDAITVEVVVSRSRTDGRPVRAAPIMVAPVITVDVHESTSYYPLTGTDSDSIVASIRANAPQSDGGLATGLTVFTSPPLEIRALSLTDGCAIDSLTLRTDIEVVLPGEVDEPLPLRLRASFDRFRAVVEEHEARHVTIRREHLESLAVALRALGAQPTCEVLGDELNRVVEEAMAVQQQAQDRFHEEDAVRVETTCAPIEAELQARSTHLETLQNDPARYNALLPEYNALVDDYNWCRRS